jgi:ribonuclease R
MKKKPVNPSRKAILVQGVLRTNARGFGFVTEITDYPDVFIPKGAIDSAVDGDKVEVHVTHENFEGKGPEGKITQVLDRARKHLALIITKNSLKSKALGYSHVLGPHRLIEITHDAKQKLKPGDRIIAEVKDWGTKNKPLKARFSQIIGNIEDPMCDIKAACEEYLIRDNFPQDVIDEAALFGKTIKKNQLIGRLDHQDQSCVTIDPKTARDFDDALYVNKLENNHFELFVHIADVAAYVPQHSKLDQEAYTRCNSTYFPGSCVPMLPEALSNGLCSLKPNVARLAATVHMNFNTTGDLIDYKIYRSVIKSKCRFSYESAKEVLDDKKESPYKALLENMVELCHLLKNKRRQRGSVDFSMPELVIDVDEKGMPKKTFIVEYDITHQMVEEFMLKANEIVAIDLDKKQIPSLFRIHEAPHEDSYKDFIKLARSLGMSLPVDPDVFDIQKMFLEIAKTPLIRHLSVAFIRSMRLASYSNDNVGHYGLGLTHYTHFTSPIRRYSDLVVQRLLFEQDHTMNLGEIADKCSKNERISFKAEMSVKNLKKIRLLDKWMQESNKKIYEALVTKIKPFGFFFDMSDLGLEGFFHFSDLKDDYYIYDEKTESLYGKRKGKELKSGVKIKVQPEQIDMIHLHVNWLFKE